MSALKWLRPLGDVTRMAGPSPCTSTNYMKDILEVAEARHDSDEIPQKTRRPLPCA
jgi:hypothetical protein